MTGGDRPPAVDPGRVSAGSTAELVLDARAYLGEGPVWDSARHVLWWVDILAGLVHAFDPATSVDRTIPVGEAVGAVAPRAAGGLIVAGANRLAALDPATGLIETLVPFEMEQPPRRMNDGKADPTGAFWAGRMDLGAAPGLGSLVRIDPDLAVTTMAAGLGIPNGMAWTSDATRMYFIDSLCHEVAAYAFDPVTRSIDAGRPLARFTDAAGLPDGCTIDAEDCLWVALWGGGCVCRIDPDGRVVDRVEVPGVSQVSSCTFGGDGLDELFITTAREGMSEAQLAREPTSGGLFRARPGVVGRVPHQFAG